MEDKVLYSDAVEQEKVVPSYSIVPYPASKLPKEYIPLLFSRWLRSYRYGNPLFKKATSKEFYENYHAYIENLLKKPDSIIRLAVLTDDHDIVLGFAVSREDVLDYIHVHTDFRKIGIAKALMPEGITTFSHITAVAILIWQSNEKYKELKFNPFA